MRERVVISNLRLAAVLATVLFAVNAATASPARVLHASDGGCDVRLRGLKTLSDPQRNLVNLHPKNTTLAEINALPQPHPTPKTRSTAFERQVWRVVAQITQFRLDAHDNVQLILFDAGAYGIARMPAPKCLPKTTRARKAIIAARQKMATFCGRPTKSWQPLGAVAYISGVGFFDIPQGQKANGANFAELHPVTAIRFVAGCR